MSHSLLWLTASWSQLHRWTEWIHAYHKMAVYCTLASARPFLMATLLSPASSNPHSCCQPLPPPTYQVICPYIYISFYSMPCFALIPLLFLLPPSQCSLSRFRAVLATGIFPRGAEYFCYLWPSWNCLIPLLIGAYSRYFVYAGTQQQRLHFRKDRWKWAAVLRAKLLITLSNRHLFLFHSLQFCLKKTLQCHRKRA